MYRVILVDDEEDVREGIKRRIDWNACGFELIATAENGQDAMEKAEALNPDVVITDIKMPYVDGLALGQWLFERMPMVKIVIFSGFDDFEYAQKAIQIGVTEYILKPINANQLTDVLQKIRKQLEEEFAQRRDLDALRSHYNESLPLLRDQFLAQLLEGRYLSNQEKIEQQVHLFDMDLTSCCFTVAFAHVDTGHLGLLSNQSELAPLSAKGFIDEHLPRYARFRSFIYNDSVAVIILLADRGQVIAITDGFNQICKMAQRYLDIVLTVGVGSVCDTLVGLRHSTTSAQTALDYRLLLGAGKCIFIDDIEPDQGVRMAIDEQDKRELVLAIKMRNCQDIRTWIDAFVVSPKVMMMPIAQYRIYLLELMALLLGFIRDYGLNTTQVFGEEFDGNFYFDRFSSAVEIGNWFYEISTTIRSLIRDQRTNSSQTIIHCAQKLIHQNFSNPNISAEMICDQLFISPAYFSTVFKKETGMSFVTYLTQVRMNEAIRLLDTTAYKTYEIALQLGYSEPSYFSYVFKKWFGVAPSKYRVHKGGGDN